MELWSGKAPFRRRTNDEIEAALKAPHPRPSDADIRLLPLDDVFASAMALDPAGRPQHADDLARALRKFLSGIDLHDVARKLGDRVREFRAAPPSPPGEDRPVLQRPPSRPTATAIGTKTFAARDEVEEWREAPRHAEGFVEEPHRGTPFPTARTVATKPLETDPKGEGSKRRAGPWVGVGRGPRGGHGRILRCERAGHPSIAQHGHGGEPRYNGATPFGTLVAFRCRNWRPPLRRFPRSPLPRSSSRRGKRSRHSLSAGRRHDGVRSTR